MNLLLRLLRGEAGLSDVPEPEWMTVLDLADRENILPWTSSRLRAQIAPHPSPLSIRLDRIQRNARFSAFLWNATLKSTLEEFHRQSIPVVSLKGPWLMQRLSGDASLKLYSDLDLLVRRNDIARAEELLAAIGFRPKRRRDDYHRPWLRDNLRLELHHDAENPLAFDFDIEAAWRRAVPAQFERVPAWLLAPSDELLFLCLHGARHRFERLSHVLDLVLAFRHFGPRAVDSLRSNSASTRVLALGALMASRLDLTISPNAPALSAADYKNIDELADGLWQERMREPSPIVDWRLQHQFYLSLERRRPQRLLARLRHLRILLTRLIEADFLFAERFHLHRTWQVWLLRPIRLLLS
jgi:Uncharacterised nucleotidyltransferase